ncbi:hypothetical protein SAMN05660836_02585 [Thermodesulforhabdus norvegica]|uniref:Uncharacterized protein n=1 Tax=Thermodesulforhabdus norvegica TaxID=39841 RepID=A0A1I4W309_9BACT|nr:hypothetical protein SAMN05660836_02585 [Thermodesulforhabdus norvegica]
MTGRLTVAWRTLKLPDSCLLGVWLLMKGLSEQEGIFAGRMKISMEAFFIVKNKT